MNLRDRDTPEAEANEIEAEYHRIIGAITDRNTVCTNAKDTLAALKFIRDEAEWHRVIALPSWKILGPDGERMKRANKSLHD